MIADTLISQIQIALIGIVVVIGLFFVWRTMSRLEEKIDMLASQVSKGPSCLPGSNTCAMGWDNADDMMVPDDADAAAEEFMRTVFGGSPSMTYQTSDDDKEKKTTVIEELPVANDEDVPSTSHAVETVDVAHEDHMSEADTDAMNPLSKSKLRKMNLDTLKDLCRERGMSAEGSKQVLTDRLLGLTRE